MKIWQIVAFLIMASGISAEANLDSTSKEILERVRLSRIPQVISALEDRAAKSLQSDLILNAREDLKKAIQLKQAIGMKESEGNAKLLERIASLEAKLGNGCEAKQLSKLARQIYLRIGMNLGAVSFDQKPAVTCSEVSWLKD